MSPPVAGALLDVFLLGRIFSVCFLNTYSSWRHQMETFSALLAICAGNSPVPGNSPQKGQWRRVLMFSLICVWINGWVNRQVGDLRRHRANYDVSVMWNCIMIMVMWPIPIPLLLIWWPLVWPGKLIWYMTRSPTTKTYLQELLDTVRTSNIKSNHAKFIVISWSDKKWSRQSHKISIFS